MDRLTLEGSPTTEKYKIIKKFVKGNMQLYINTCERKYTKSSLVYMMYYCIYYYIALLRGHCLMSTKGKNTISTEKRVRSHMPLTF